MTKLQEILQKCQKVLMILSLVFMVLCLIATIWVASVLHDSSMYLYSVVFVLAIIWFSITIYKSYKK